VPLGYPIDTLVAALQPVHVDWLIEKLLEPLTLIWRPCRSSWATRPATLRADRHDTPCTLSRTTRTEEAESPFVLHAAAFPVPRALEASTAPAATTPAIAIERFTTVEA
jgi:hypothetical protein